MLLATLTPLYDCALTVRTLNALDYIGIERLDQLLSINIFEIACMLKTKAPLFANNHTLLEIQGYKVLYEIASIVDSF